MLRLHALGSNTPSGELDDEAFRSDDKFLQMVNHYESTPEFGSGSGGCRDDEMADDEDGGEDEEDEEDDDS
nr:hypothetical protein [Tanacetum cinerariifolium]